MMTFASDDNASLQNARPMPKHETCQKRLLQVTGVNLESNGVIAVPDPPLVITTIFPPREKSPIMLEAALSDEGL